MGKLVRIRLSKMTKEEMSTMMTGLARLKASKMTVEQRKAHSLKMVKAKRKKHANKH